MTLRTIWTAFKRMVMGEKRERQMRPMRFRDVVASDGAVVREWESREKWLRAEQYESAAKLLEKAQRERAMAVKNHEKRSHIDAEIKRLRTLMLKLEMEAKR